MNEQQLLRAKTLELAIAFLGQLPKGSNLDSLETYKDYFYLAKHLEEYVQHGTFFHQTVR